MSVAGDALAVPADFAANTSDLLLFCHFCSMASLYVGAGFFFGAATSFLGAALNFVAAACFCFGAGDRFCAATSETRLQTVHLPAKE